MKPGSSQQGALWRSGAPTNHEHQLPARERGPVEVFDLQRRRTKQILFVVKQSSGTFWVLEQEPAAFSGRSVSKNAELKQGSRENAKYSEQR